MRRRTQETAPWQRFVAPEDQEHPIKLQYKLALERLARVEDLLKQKRYSVAQALESMRQKWVEQPGSLQLLEDAAPASEGGGKALSSPRMRDAAKSPMAAGFVEVCGECCTTIIDDLEVSVRDETSGEEPPSPAAVVKSICDEVQAEISEPGFPERPTAPIRGRTPLSMLSSTASWTPSSRRPERMG